MTAIERLIVLIGFVAFNLGLLAVIAFGGTEAQTIAAGVLGGEAMLIGLGGFFWFLLR